jgi:energy-coupling factor transporter ATP-binding protein EcfA2
MHLNISSANFEECDEEQRRTQERRLAMYSAVALLAAVPVERIFVSHRSFTSTLTALDRAFQLGKELSLPQGVCLTGPTGSGKTSVIRYFEASLPHSTLYKNGTGVLRLRLPERPSLGYVISTLLTKLHYPLPKCTDQTVGAKRMVLIEALGLSGSRLVAFDEADHICSPSIRKVSGNAKGNEVTDLIRELMEEARVAIALAGDAQLKTLERVDPALWERVSVKEEFKNFSLNQDWTGFIRAFAAASSSFDLSFLSEEGQPRLLFMATKGNPRRFKLLVVEAVLVASSKGESVLSREVLEQAFKLVNGDACVETNPWLISKKRTKPSTVDA